LIWILEIVLINEVDPSSKLMTQIMRSKYNIKSKPEKIIMLNSQSTKIVMNKIEKKNSTKKGI
jgi:hypothetical protein